LDLFPQFSKKQRKGRFCMKQKYSCCIWGGRLCMGRKRRGEDKSYHSFFLALNFSLETLPIGPAVFSASCIMVTLLLAL
jgi:hypothetical protein